MPNSNYGQNNKKRIPNRGIGIAIIFAFIAIPLLFVILYMNSSARHGDNEEQEPIASHNQNRNGSHVTFEQGDDTDRQGDSINLPDGDPDRYSDELSLPGGDPDVSGGEAMVGQANAGGNARGSEKIAYLTFDDGPSRGITCAILDILRDENIIATFFILPTEDNDDIFQRILDEGHELANHSYTHIYSTLYESNLSSFRNDVSRAGTFISERFGYTMTGFRFPGGSMQVSGNALTTRIDTIRELGYRHYDWHVDPQDWRRNKSAADITKDVLDYTSGREHVIILLHDYVYSHNTVEALPGIIAGLRNQGYDFDMVKNFPTALRTGLRDSS